MSIWAEIFTKQNGMVVILALGIAAIAASFWRAQLDDNNKFNLFDLIMEKGKLDLLKLCFMIAFVLSCWVIADKEIKNTLDSQTYWNFLIIWSIPLSGKVIFNEKTLPIMFGRRGESEDGK